MSGTNVGQLNVGIGFTTEELTADAATATGIVTKTASQMEQLSYKMQTARVSAAEAAADKIRKSLQSEQQAANESFNIQIKLINDLSAAKLLTAGQAQQAAELAFSKKGPGAGLSGITPYEAEMRKDLESELAARRAALDERLANHRAAMAKLRTIEAEEAAWRSSLAEKHAAQMASRGLGAGGLAGAATPSQAETLAARLRTAGIIAQVRGQQASRDAADAMMRAMQQEGKHLHWSVMTEKEKFAIRKQADLEHLAMLRQFQAITDADFAKLSKRAGTLGLGSTPFDNNMRNTGFRGAMIAQQVGFGVQDFMSQMTNAKTAAEGMGRGIMALSNNVQMMGAAWGGTALAVTAIGGALAGIILPSMIKWVLNAEQLERTLALSENRLKSIIDLAKAVSEAEVKGATEAKRQQLEDEIAIADKTRAKLGEQTVAEMNKLRDLKAKEKDGMWEIVPGLGVTLGSGTLTGARNQIEQAVQVQEAKVKQLQGAVDEAMRTASHARAQLQEIGPGTTAGNVGALKDELGVQSEIAKIRAESDDKSIISAGKALEERQRMLMEEGVAIINMMEGRSEAERAILERELEDRERQYAETEKKIAATRGIVMMAEQRERLKDDLKRNKDQAKEDIQEEVNAIREKQHANREEIDRLQEMGINPAGMSSMSVSGTSAAASAINRALSGGRSEEDDRKRMIKELEKVNKNLEGSIKVKNLELANLNSA